MSLKYIKVYTDTLPQYLLHSLCNSNVKANEIDSIKTKLQKHTSSSIVSYLQLALIKMKKTSVDVSNFSKILFRNGELNLLCRQCLSATGRDGDDRPFIVLTETKPIDMVGQDGLRTDADVRWHLCCIATVEGPFADDRTSVFPPSCCPGCGGRGVGVAAAGREEAWAYSGRGAVICVRVFSCVSHL